MGGSGDEALGDLFLRLTRFACRGRALVGLDALGRADGSCLLGVEGPAVDCSDLVAVCDRRQAMMRVASIAARWQIAELWCSLRSTTSRRYFAASVGSIWRARSAAMNRAVRSPGSPPLWADRCLADAGLVDARDQAGESPCCVEVGEAVRIAEQGSGSPGPGRGSDAGYRAEDLVGIGWGVETLDPLIELVDLGLDRGEKRTSASMSAASSAKSISEPAYSATASRAAARSWSASGCTVLAAAGRGHDLQRAERLGSGAVCAGRRTG